MREARSFCRICSGYCGLTLSIDDGEKIISIRGDREHPASDGYACIKGLQSAHLYHGPQRILKPLRREVSGEYVQLAQEQAFDEIAAKLRTIIDTHGPDAVGVFKGGNVYQDGLSPFLLNAFLSALGSTSLFSSNTIDQSAKAISVDRLGSWAAGRNSFSVCDTIMFVGTNPLVAVSMFGVDHYNVTKKFKAFKARGGKIITIDPRRTETANLADIFIQPRPGQDVTIAAGFLRAILNEGWHDQDFCGQYADGVDRLREMVEPFTLEYVEERADVPPDLLREAARLIAVSHRGAVLTGTGPSMSPRSNLSQHLFDAINVICGHFPRVGDRIPNPGVMRKREWRAEVVPPGRCWEQGPKSRVRGLGRLFGEKFTGVLAQEITTPGQGQIRALLVHGGNPASSVPDQRRIVNAFKSLDLLVAVDPEMTTTAQLAHYVLPPKLQFETSNMVGLIDYETALRDVPFQQFVEPAIACPEDADLIDDWYFYWILAKKLGLQLTLEGVALDMTEPPSTEELFRILFRNGRVSFDEIKQYPGGHIFASEAFVEPGSPGANAKFDLIPDDIKEEIAAVVQEEFSIVRRSQDGHVFDLLLICRRLREVFNSGGRSSPEIRKRQPFNAAYFNPTDIAAQGFASGDRIEIVSDNGAIPAVIASDPTMRPGVVSMAHGWGGLPGDDEGYDRVGACTGVLINTERDYEAINAMPRQSSIPIYIRAPSNSAGTDREQTIALAAS